MKNCQNSIYRTWKVALALTGLCTLSACVKTMPLQELSAPGAASEPARSVPVTAQVRPSVGTPVAVPVPTPKPPSAVSSPTPIKPPTPVSTPSTAKKGDNTGTKSLTHDEFLKRLSKQKLPSFVGTPLQLTLKRGGDGGWEGFIQDVQSLVFYSCPSGSKFNGGALLAKIVKIRSNDMGIFVQLDRCDK